jgi:hypothetical protein
MRPLVARIEALGAEIHGIRPIGHRRPDGVE